MTRVEHSCTCDNHLTRWPHPLPKHTKWCRRHSWLVSVEGYAGNGTGVGASGRGDDDPELMERVARTYNMV